MLTANRRHLPRLHMMNPTASLPVSLGHPYGGLAECEGLLRLETLELVLEYQTRDSVLGIVKSGVREARIPRDQIASVTIEKGWFGTGTKIMIQTTRLKPVGDIPGMTQGRLVFGIASKDFPVAETLVADLKLDSSLPTKPAPLDTALD
jgi:hypothetical protein